MGKSVFKICSCDSTMIHGCIYFTNGKRSQPIFSLKDARTILEAAEQDGFISSSDKDDLIQDVARAGLPDDGPEKEAISAYKEYEKNLTDILKNLRMSRDELIVIPAADLNAPD